MNLGGRPVTFKASVGPPGHEREVFFVMMPLGMVLDPVLKAFGRRGCMSVPEPGLFFFKLNRDSFRRAE